MISTEGTEYEITYAIAPYSAKEASAHRFQAITTGGTIASELYVATDTLTIFAVETDRQYRREGIATELFNFAEKTLPEVLHSRPEYRTEEGHGWAEAVGGDAEDHDDTEDEDEDQWS